MFHWIDQFFFLTIRTEEKVLINKQTRFYRLTYKNNLLCLQKKKKDLCRILRFVFLYCFHLWKVKIHNISISELSSKKNLNFCCAYSCGNGNFPSVIFISFNGLKSGQTIRIPFIKLANLCAISLWHKRCLAVGQGNRLMREQSSFNWGFSPSQRVSMSPSWIVFRLSYCNWRE